MSDTTTLTGKKAPKTFDYDQFFYIYSEYFQINPCPIVFGCRFGPVAETIFRVTGPRS